MPKFVIERNIPNASGLSPVELKAISAKSCAALNELGPTIHWFHSYVADGKVYCIYLAPSEVVAREHARFGNSSADCVSEANTAREPSTAE